MGPHLIEQRYENHKGINPTDSDLTRSKEFSSGMKNAQYAIDGSPEKRKGYQGHAKHAGGFGTFEYNRIDPDSDVASPEVLTLDKNLFKQNIVTLTITYVGINPSATTSAFYDPVTSQYRVQILEGLNVILDFPCGIGIDEGAPVTFAQLATAINLTANFTAVVAGLNTTPAAFISIVRDWDLVASPFVFEAKSWSQVNSTIADPLNNYYLRRNDLSFENASSVQQSNVLYVASGWSDLFKYDGQTFYRAGLPNLASITSGIVAAGAITGSNYVHQAQYIQHDAAGLIVEGNILKVASPINLAGEKANITVANIQANSGFNTNCAIVAGAGQNIVNIITVDDGSGGENTMKIGDTAFFYDAVLGEYVERKVIGRTATTIEVGGNPVTVADNAVISNNLRIAIYRNYNSATTPIVFYLVIEIPNNSFAATQVYQDNTVDTSLGALYIRALSDRSLPPRARYVSAFQNQLVLGGLVEFPRRLAWSDVDGTEYFPSDTNQEDIQSLSGDVIVGIGPAGTVFGILTDKSTYVLSGTLGDNNIIIEQKSTDVGCVAHASIVQTSVIMAWWSPRGPYYMVNGQIPQPLGINAEGTGRMESILTDGNKSATERFQPQRITSINWPEEKKVLWFIPAETNTGGQISSNANSRIFSYDYVNDAWLEWDNINASSGFAHWESELYFQERRYSAFTVSVQSILYRFHNLKDAWSYEDNNNPIDWDYGTCWECFGKPAVLKKFLELQIYNLTDVPNNSFTITVKQEINYQRDSSVAEFDLDIAGSGYGIDEYGIDPYGGIAQGVYRHDLNRTKVKSTRMRFTNNEHHENCLLTGWEFLASTPYKPEFRK